MVLSVLCPECGAPVPPGGACRENFDALLALEWELPGGAGALAHFYAVSSYVLQHPDSMSYTVEAIDWLRSAVGRAVDGDVSVEDLRRNAAQYANGPSRVTRRSGDPIPSCRVKSWHMTVADVLGGGVTDYFRHVEAWARSVLADLDAADG